MDLSEETRIGGTWVLRMGHLKAFAAGGGCMVTLNIVREPDSWFQV